MPPEARPEVLLLNGPNLGRLGKREVARYGSTSLAEIERAVRDIVHGAGYALVADQRNCEGALIDVLETHGHARGAIVNPGAFMINGWALRDAMAAFEPPWIEVHITNVWGRDEARHLSVTAPHAAGVVMGFGAIGYSIAARALVDLIDPAALPNGVPARLDPVGVR